MINLIFVANYSLWEELNFFALNKSGKNIFKKLGPQIKERKEFSEGHVQGHFLYLN